MCWTVGIVRCLGVENWATLGWPFLFKGVVLWCGCGMIGSFFRSLT